MMSNRWVLAAAAAFGLGLLTLPAISTHRDVPGESPAAAAAAASGCDAKAAPAKLNATLKDMHGKDVRLADYKGKVLLLNFWATWCGPCKIEIPAFVELQQKYGAKGLVILGISIDDTPAELRPFAEAMTINYPLLMMTEEVENAYGPIWAVPTTFLVTREGVVCRKHLGPATKAQFEAEIKPLL